MELPIKKWKVNITVSGHVKCFGALSIAQKPGSFETTCYDKITKNALNQENKLTYMVL